MIDIQQNIIGFIGVGFMGHGMAKNIIAGGFALRVLGHLNRAPVESLIAQGAQELGSIPEMVAACDIIHLCLPNSDIVEGFIAAILDHPKPGLIVIDCTTSDPSSTQRLAGQLAALGMHLVDAPLGRTPKEAEAGTLDAMVGCDEALFDRLRPVIACWSGTVTRIGPVGSAHKMKLIMNFIAMSYGALYSEAVVLAAKAGLSPQAVQDVIGASRMSNGFFETFMRYTVGRDPEAHKFTLANAEKDIRYVATLARDVGVVNLMGAAAMQYYTHAVATGKGADFIPMLSDHVGAMNGIDLAKIVAEAAKGNDNDITAD